MPRVTSLRHVPVLLALAAGLAACGGSGGSQQADATVRAAKPKAHKHARIETVTTPTPPLTTPQTTTTPTPPPTRTATTPATTTPNSGGAAAPPRTTRATPPRVRTAPAPPSTTATPPPARTTPSNTSPSSQAGQSGPATQTSCGSIANGFLSGVQATGLDCGSATTVANNWLSSVGSAGPESDVTTGGYACSGRRDGDAVDVTCIDNAGRRVTFAAHN
jgi:hypothetical protein